MKHVGSTNKGFSAGICLDDERTASTRRVVVSIDKPGLTIMAHYVGAEEIAQFRAACSAVIAAIDEAFPAEVEE